MSPYMVTHSKAAVESLVNLSCLALLSMEHVGIPVGPHLAYMETNKFPTTGPQSNKSLFSEPIGKEPSRAASVTFPLTMSPVLFLLLHWHRCG